MYNAIVTKIKTAPHPDPQTTQIKVGYCFGHTVVVGIETPENSLGIFFPTDGQLSDEFCKANNLYPVYDENGVKVGGGFIDAKLRRVKAQRFRGVRSEGFWLPISCLNYLNLKDTPKEGFVFTELEGKPICNKYISKATRSAMNATKGKSSKKESPQMPMHLETLKFKYYSRSIPEGSVIYITEKLHGTSGRTGWAKIPDKSLTLGQRIRQLFSKKPLFQDTYDYLTGSRRVVKNFDNGPGFYGKEDFRYQASEIVKPFLRKGESVYYEIVGYVSETEPIMHGTSNEALGKEFKKKFGKTTEWRYGCLPGQFKIYIYNWMLSNEDGSVQYSYPWEYIEQRCQESGGVLETVPFLQKVQYDTQEQLSALTELATNLTEDLPTTLDTHLREGVCLRVEKGGHLVDIYKLKATSFGILEGYLSPQTVDLEAVESYQ